MKLCIYKSVILKYLRLANTHERTKRMGRNTRYVYIRWNLESKVSSKGRKVEVSAKKELELKTAGTIGNCAVEGKCIQLTLEGKCAQSQNVTGEENGRGQQTGEEQNCNSASPGERNGISFKHVTENYSSMYQNSIESHFCGSVVRGRLFLQKPLYIDSNAFDVIHPFFFFHKIN